MAWMNLTQKETIMSNIVEKEKVVEIYLESMKIVRRGLRNGLTKGDITSEIEKEIRGVVDRED